MVISPNMNERIRQARENLGLTSAMLAAKAKVSPALMSLIEAGKRLPSIEAAERIAAALGDDPRLYRSWVMTVRAGRSQGLGAGQQSNLEFGHFLFSSAEPAWRRSIERGEPAGEWFRFAQTTPEQQLTQSQWAGSWFASGRAVEVPVLKGGADPGEGALVVAKGLAASLVLDRRLIGLDKADVPFACQVDTSGAWERARGIVSTGDWVVFARGRRRVDPGKLHAVRAKGRLVFGRVLATRSSLLLLPAEGSQGFDTIEVAGKADLPRVIAGRQVLLIRR